MPVARYALVGALCGALLVSSQTVATAQKAAQPVPAYQQFLSPASPLEVVAAKKVDRVAWIAFEEGKRNAYTAVAPAFAPVRLTSFLKDDGIDMSGIQDLGRRIDRDVRARHDRRRTARAGSPTRRRIRTGPSARSGRCAPPAAPAWRVAEAPSTLRAGARRQLGALREGRPDLPREGHAGAARERDGPRREAVHPGVGRAERADVVARRQEDRVRQHAHRSQLHRRLRRGDAHA